MAFPLFLTKRETNTEIPTLQPIRGPFPLLPLRGLAFNCADFSYENKNTSNAGACRLFFFPLLDPLQTGAPFFLFLLFFFFMRVLDSITVSQLVGPPFLYWIEFSLLFLLSRLPRFARFQSGTFSGLSPLLFLQPPASFFFLFFWFSQVIKALSQCELVSFFSSFTLEHYLDFSLLSFFPRLGSRGIALFKEAFLPPFPFKDALGTRSSLFFPGTLLMD